MKDLQIINNGKAVRVLINDDKCLIDPDLYNFKLYVLSHYSDTKGARKIKNGYSFPITDDMDLQDWVKEFSLASDMISSKTVLF